MNTPARFLDPKSLPDYIGKYRILGVIGRGGMGVIYKALQEPLNRTVALKVLMPLDANSDESSRRFEIEARAISLLQHQNIVSIYEYGEESGFPFFAMQHVDGVDLGKKIADKKAMPFGEIVDIAKQICRGLRYAHCKDVIHRDIKPQNVLIDSNGIVLLSDFGIAKVFAYSTITVTGMAVGTPEYMSPEQAEGKPLDFQTDIYSAGVVIYEMITKRPPFTGENAVSIAYKQVHELPVPPSVRRREVPKRLELIVLKALKKDKRERYHSAEEMLEHLDSVDLDEKAERPTVSFSFGKSDDDREEIVDKRITDRRSGDRRGGVRFPPTHREFWKDLIYNQGIALAAAASALALLFYHLLAQHGR